MLALPDLGWEVLSCFADVAAACSAFPSSCHQSVDPGQQDRSTGGHHDRIDHPALTGAAEQTHDPSPYQGPGNAQQNVADKAVTSAHNLAGYPACYQAYDNPPKYDHSASNGEHSTDSGAVLIT